MQKSDEIMCNSSAEIIPKITIRMKSVVMKVKITEMTYTIVQYT